MTKYRAIKTDCSNGHTHDSKLEAGRCDQLHEMEAEGKILGLQLQPVFPIWINDRKVCEYIADFTYFVSDCRLVEDVKGATTPVFNLKKKLVEACHPGTVITLYPPRKRKKRKAKK